MSSIAFHSPSGCIRISGRERAMMGAICHRFLMAQIGDLKHDDLEWVEQAFPAGHYLNAEAARMRLARGDDARFELRRRLAQAVETFLYVGSDREPAVLNGEPVTPFSLQLNSALQWGNRAIQLAAKLHGQCEIHCYVEGEHRAWLADLVDEAIEAGVFRPDPWGYDGWEKLAAFLRARADEPVATSYSVTDTFPNPGFAPEGMTLDPDDPYEAWDKIDPAEQWRHGMVALRAEPGLQLSPDRLAKYFDSGLTGREFVRRAKALVPTKEPVAA